MAPLQAQDRAAGHTRQGGHAVVVGGGIAGLLTSQVLLGRFERVTLIERDRYPRRPGSRRGVPQSRCLHMLMARGLLLFEQLLPGWGAELVRSGAVAFDFGAQSALRLPQGWLPRFHSGISMYACSRGLLEWCLRRRLLRDSRLRILEERTVLGLLANAASDRVTGVRMRDERGAREEHLDAELVVVTTGRGSALPRWLGELGLPPPQQTVVGSRTQYASRWFAIPDSFHEDWKLLSISPAAGGERRSGLVFQTEGNRWGVVLLGPQGEPTPANGRDFLRAASRLADGRLHEAIAAARPLSPIFRHGESLNHIYHYERMARWPERLVALGDAVCSLDPYFGLGMTASAAGAAELQAHLSRGLGAPGDAGAARRFQQQLAETNTLPWRLAIGQSRDGGLSPQDVAYLQCMYHLAPRSTAVSRVLMERMHLLAPPDVLWSPELMELVRHELGRTSSQAPGSPGAE